jgi:hypothetical protein
MFKKLIITSVFMASTIIAYSAFAAVTMDDNRTDERTDRRTVTDTIVKMDKTLDALLEETKKNNALLAELLKGKGAATNLPVR